MSSYELHLWLLDLAIILILVVFAVGLVATASILIIAMIQDKRKERGADGEEVSALHVQDSESQDGSGEKETDE